jgi:hypothetical protein
MRKKFGTHFQKYWPGLLKGRQVISLPGAPAYLGPALIKGLNPKNRGIVQFTRWPARSSYLLRSELCYHYRPGTKMDSSYNFQVNYSNITAFSYYLPIYVWLVEADSFFLPKKMEQIECSETSAIINQTPGNHPKEDILYLSFRFTDHLCIHCLLGDTQRQARELISGPSWGAKTKVMSFNSTQSRAVIGLLTGHNTLRRHLYLLGLQDSPLCTKCGVMEETSAHILCECEAMASFRHAYLSSFFFLVS